MTDQPTSEDLARDLRADLHLARSMHLKGLLADWFLQALGAAVRRAMAAEMRQPQLEREEAMRDG